MTDLDDFLAEREQHLVRFRRDLHRHPELGRQEFRTTERIAEQLTTAGLAPRTLPGGCGLVCDIGPAGAGPVIGLRADIDALPVADATRGDHRSAVEGVSHACGHDVHTTVVLGAGLLLARVAGRGELGRGVRLIFQPAEELMPGGAHDVIAAGGLDGVDRLFAVHCDPALNVGRVGLRVGPVTSATDRVEVRVLGAGGHTARPHLTGDLGAAIGDVLARVPGILARRVDPRAGASLVWGEVHAGTVANVIPRSGVVAGTLRILDRNAWELVPPVLAGVIRSVTAPYGVQVEIVHTRGVPPVVNDAGAVGDLAASASRWIGADAVHSTEQSLGGEDFAWFLEKVPGALARLGVKDPGAATAADLHTPAFDVDERCIGVGVRLLAGVALLP